jgi:hypothetical protein
MMSDIDWTSIVVVLWPAVCIGLYELLFVRSRRQRLARLEESLAALVRASTAVDQLILSQERVHGALTNSVKRTNDRLGQLELRAASRPYEQAIDLAANGGSEDRLIRYFGLTTGEASLVRLLHGEKQPEAPTL